MPLGHSHKPPLCALLRPLALPLSACTEATAGAQAGAAVADAPGGAQAGALTDALAGRAVGAAATGVPAGAMGAAAPTPAATEFEQRQAWRALPKLELFARELRPGWHSAGNEVLRFQHESFWEPTR